MAARYDPGKLAASYTGPVMIVQGGRDLQTTMDDANAIKAGRFEEVKAAQASVRDLKAAFFLVMDERAKLDKLRKQVAGTVGTGQLDLHAARDEIGRRLARLRDANGG